MLKTYEITQEGKSNGNVIAPPFKIMVTSLDYETRLPLPMLILKTSTHSQFSNNLPNDDVANSLKFDLPDMASSKNKDLQETIEILLQEKYPGNWAVFTQE